MVEEAKVEVLKNGVRNCDFIIFKGLNRPIGKYEINRERLRVFQRCMKRLVLLCREDMKNNKDDEDHEPNVAVLYHDLCVPL